MICHQGWRYSGTSPNPRPEATHHERQMRAARGHRAPEARFCDDQFVSLLPASNCSLLVRTDFSDDQAWEAVIVQAGAESEEGFCADLEPVSDPTSPTAAADVTSPRS